MVCHQVVVKSNYPTFCSVFNLYFTYYILKLKLNELILQVEKFLHRTFGSNWTVILYTIALYTIAVLLSKCYVAVVLVEETHFLKVERDNETMSSKININLSFCYER